jgi:hypothetical protein
MFPFPTPRSLAVQLPFQKPNETSHSFCNTFTFSCSLLWNTILKFKRKLCMNVNHEACYVSFHQMRMHLIFNIYLCCLMIYLAFVRIYLNIDPERFITFICLFSISVMPIVRRRVKGPMWLHFLIGVSLSILSLWVEIFYPYTTHSFFLTKKKKNTFVPTFFFFFLKSLQSYALEVYIYILISSWSWVGGSLQSSYENRTKPIRSQGILATMIISIYTHILFPSNVTWLLKLPLDLWLITIEFWPSGNFKSHVTFGGDKRGIRVLHISVLFFKYYDHVGC